MRGSQRVLAVTLAAVLTVVVPGAVAAEVRLGLPKPGGAHRVGTTSVHLVDAARTDPLAPTVRARELMVRLWYPAARSSRTPVASYLPTIHAGLLTQQLNDLLGTTYPADLLTFPTNSRADAPAAPGPRRPLLLFSPGLGINAALYTAIFEELASRGYVVASMDHTFDAPVVEFPGGRVEFSNPDAPFEQALAVRVADTRFVLDQLTMLATGHNPDASHRPPPRGLGNILDLTRIAAFGHSLGSITAVGAIDTDHRIRAGAALDGNPLGQASLDRPFLLFGNPSHRRAEDPDWAAFYDRLRDQRLHLILDGIGHNDLSDVAIFKHTINLGAIFDIGTLHGHRAITIQRRYLTAWFDHTLRGRTDPVLRDESPHFPEIDFQP